MKYYEITDEQIFRLVRAFQRVKSSAEEELELLERIVRTQRIGDEDEIQTDFGERD